MILWKSLLLIYRVFNSVFDVLFLNMIYRIFGDLKKFCYMKDRDCDYLREGNLEKIKVV